MMNPDESSRSSCRSRFASRTGGRRSCRPPPICPAKTGHRIRTSCAPSAGRGAGGGAWKLVNSIRLPIWQKRGACRTPCQPTAAARLSRAGGPQALGLQARGARRDPVETDRCRGPAVARTAGAGVRLSLSESSPETSSQSARHARPVAGAARTPSDRARNSTAGTAAIPTGAPRPRPVRCG